MEQQTIVELKDIRKEFPGVVALDKVNMQIQKGRVHALVGENGAGKSTLMKILSGTYTTYGGQILYEGKQIHLSCEKDAFKLGISIVAQELNCIEELTIEENLYLGREPRHNGCFLDKKKRTELTQKYLDLMGLELDPATKMGELSIAQRQMVEILKSISRNCRVIILDEPTSVLTSVEAELLFRKVKELKAQGIAFVFISHRLEEVFELCEDYTVLRDGKCIESGALQDVDQDRLISLMVGREIENIYPKLGPCGTEVVLEGKGLTSRPTFHDVSFQIHKGEILGFAGMVGAGRSEVARTVFGLDALESGEIWLDGKPCRIHMSARRTMTPARCRANIWPRRCRRTHRSCISPASRTTSSILTARPAWKMP
jgi:ABC-type sugar transport system ATPase subunit